MASSWSPECCAAPLRVQRSSPLQGKLQRFPPPGRVRRAAGGGLRFSRSGRPLPESGHWDVSLLVAPVADRSVAQPSSLRTRSGTPPWAPSPFSLPTRPHPHLGDLRPSLPASRLPVSLCRSLPSVPWPRPPGRTAPPRFDSCQLGWSLPNTLLYLSLQALRPVCRRRGLCLESLFPPGWEGFSRPREPGPSRSWP